MSDRGRQPAWLRDLGSILRGVAGHDVARIDENGGACTALLELHALADEACGGVGIPISPADKKASTRAENARDPRAADAIEFLMRANLRLAQRGTLAEVDASVVRVLPKLRTPQTGITLRSLSQHLSAHVTEVEVKWEFHETLCADTAERINLLVLPWPEMVGARSFKPVLGGLRNMDSRRFGFFSYEPSVPFPVAEAIEVVNAAREIAESVDAVILPECAIAEDQVDELQRRLGQEGVKLLVAGVHADKRNYAHLGMARGSTGGQEWLPSRQHKHHRWCLDASQIRQYHLGAALHPTKRWWEHIDINQRELRFVTANGWLTVCHLICEDLARQDPVASIIRGVGPSLVVALLMDGPQLEQRWPGRYATVLAEDPGSSVLTVTSIGMCQRSRPPGHDPSRVVGLWKDPSRGAEELYLEPGARGLLLTLCAAWKTEWSADGRDDRGTTAQLILSAIEQVHHPRRATSTAIP